ncbi:MAG: 2-amino-4-hydroxy-6-hydroxymethyldihydropteridine pyrophosphokinase [Rhodothermaceae bacterium]|nr:MAG: 2-amino-4-hydroxy-6-hydroxymethyldihydropteridine pyrophosphokinase [Rhodothermaceae bacterium]
MPVDAYVALGANLGDRLQQLRTAVARLDADAGIRVVAASPLYEGPAHTLTPGEKQPPYLNAVVHLRTRHLPEALLDVLLALEHRAGRDRQAGRWTPRPLDLDLLVYDALTCSTPTLTLPHPRLGNRRFVLRPLADLAPNLYVPPPYDTTVRILLDRCPDPTPLVRLPQPLWTGELPPP